MKHPMSLIFLLFSLFLPAAPMQTADDVIEKTYCTQGIAYDSIDDLKLDLLNNAKKAVIDELFGEFIVASTAVENFVVTKDQIQTSSLGFVRVEGNTKFHNGEDFADVCVTIAGYVTAEDRAKFVPEPLDNKYCDADDDMTTAQLIAYVKDETIIQALIEYDPKLKDADKDSLLQLVQKVTYLETGFISDTQTYCATFEGEVVPVEVMAFLGEEKTEGSQLSKSENNTSSTVNIEPITAPELTTLMPLVYDGVEASGSFDGYNQPRFAVDGDLESAWINNPEQAPIGNWIEIKFRQPKVVSKIRINRNPKGEVYGVIRGQLTAATLTFSDNTQQSVTFQGFDGWEEVEIVPVETNRVKVQIDQIYPDSNLVMLFELEFWGTEPTQELSSSILQPPPLTAALPIDGFTALSTFDNYNEARFAMDGDIDTVWINNASEKPIGSWIEAKFRETRTISKLRLYRNPVGEVYGVIRGQLKTATLIFTDNSRQTIVFRGLENWEEVEITPVETTSVKVQIDSIYPDSNLVMVYEIELWGE